MKKFALLLSLTIITLSSSLYASTCPELDQAVENYSLLLADYNLVVEQYESSLETVERDIKPLYDRVVNRDDFRAAFSVRPMIIEFIKELEEAEELLNNIYIDADLFGWTEIEGEASCLESYEKLTDNYATPLSNDAISLSINYTDLIDEMEAYLESIDVYLGQ